MQIQREQRTKIQLEVAYEEPGRQVFFSALNLSTSGVFLVSEEPPQLGQEVRVVLSLPPDGLFVRMRGLVVRHAGRGEPRGFAVAFAGVDERTQADLQEFLRTSATS